MNQTLSYCYLPDDFTGHRPANRELVERVGRGAVYSWPSTTTMHMDLMRRTRTTLDDAHNDGVLDAAAHQGFADLANPEITEPIHHRSGCPVQRTGKCLCTYLAQWDARADFEQTLIDEMAKPLTAFTAQEEAAGRVISTDTLNGRTSEWDGVFQTPTKLGPGVLVIPDEMWDDLDPAALKVSGSPEFISASEYQARQAKVGPTPFQSHLTDVEEDLATCGKHRKMGWHYTARMSCAEFDAIPGDLKPEFIPRDVEGNPMPVDTALLANTKQSLTFWKGQAKHWQKGYWIMAGAALLGWGTAVARGVWGF